MVNCVVTGCKGVVVDGLKELMDASHSGYRIFKDNGFRFYWCANHEQEVLDLAATKITKPLTKKELRTELK